MSKLDDNFTARDAVPALYDCADIYDAVAKYANEYNVSELGRFTVEVRGDKQELVLNLGDMMHHEYSATIEYDDNSFESLWNLMEATKDNDIDRMEECAEKIFNHNFVSPTVNGNESTVKRECAIIENSLLDRRMITSETVLLNPSPGTVKRCVNMDVFPQIVFSPEASQHYDYLEACALMRAYVKAAPQVLELSDIKELVDVYCGFSAIPSFVEFGFGFEVNPYNDEFVSMDVRYMSSQTHPRKGIGYEIVYERGKYYGRCFYPLSPRYFRYEAQSFAHLLRSKISGRFNFVSTHARDFPPSDFRSSTDLCYSNVYPDYEERVVLGERVQCRIAGGVLYDVGGSDVFSSRQFRCKRVAHALGLQCHLWKDKVARYAASPNVCVVYGSPFDESVHLPGVDKLVRRPAPFRIVRGKWCNVKSAAVRGAYPAGSYTVVEEGGGFTVVRGEHRCVDGELFVDPAEIIYTSQSLLVVPDNRPSIACVSQTSLLSFKRVSGKIEEIDVAVTWDIDVDPNRRVFKKGNRFKPGAYTIVTCNLDCAVIQGHHFRLGDDCYYEPKHEVFSTFAPVTIAAKIVDGAIGPARGKMALEFSCGLTPLKLLTKFRMLRNCRIYRHWKTEEIGDMGAATSVIIGEFESC